ncbi:glycosyltransferase family 2 protein [Candidatus Parcubacteria bacterium]|nr:MAG: glycosyltransferase family 2 protein [Candidatus Parcubacteria bacterium]
MGGRSASAPGVRGKGMRLGQNPVKVARPPLPPPREVTVVVVNFIPYLSGYFERSLEVLQISLESLWANTGVPFDLLVFDNASCAEVREYLLAQHRAGRIQYLVLSEKNVGIPGAWNFAFQAAPGKIVAFADYDIYFYPGWLKAHLEVLQTFPKVGMVTGTPVRPPVEFSSSTLAWAERTPDVVVERGAFQAWEDYRAHALSLGFSEEEAMRTYREGEDIRLRYQGVEAFVGAGHFQFVAPKTVLQEVLPLPMKRAMGDERELDRRVNARGYLRLCLPRRYVEHIGNVPSPEILARAGRQGVSPAPKQTSRFKRWLYALADFPWVRRPLLFLYNRVFQLYYRRVSE